MSAQKKIATLHCVQAAHDLPHDVILEEFAPDVLILGGDTPYTVYDEDANSALKLIRWDYPVTQAEGSSDVPVEQARYFAHYERVMRIPGINQLLNTVPEVYWAYDDHEVGDDWDHSAAHAFGAHADQEEINETFINAHRAWIQAHADLPFANTTPDIPPEALTGSPANAIPANYPPTHYVVRDPEGLIDIIVLNCIIGRSRWDDTDDVSKIMLGPNQRAWLDATLKSSTTPFKLVWSSKNVLCDVGPGALGDSWQRYQTQLEAIIDDYQATVKGVLWCGGDAHNPFWGTGGTWGDAATVSAASGGSTNPASDSTLVTPPDGTNFTIPKRKDSPIEIRCAGLITVTPTLLTYEMKDIYGEVIWSNTMIPTSNAWQS